ncbi:universal stress protein [Nitrospira lenta]|uniref:Putative Universal stress protein n=1 Tax=Nitrospira lenta TaxID=1436998 RepID=A0A330L088_9BACT|nr:universal stress protein [Nitrospira lenta]SPP63064.1 putative Universal stress protein [Nitrospira lenta]
MSGETDSPRVFLATDFSKWALRAEEYACCLAATWRATLTVLTVLEFPPGINPEYPVNQVYLSELMKAGAKQLVELKARASSRGIALHTRIATGIPCEEVLAAVKAEDSDLVVVGTKGKSGLAHVLLGSTAERVIRTASCPVLTVRMDPDEVYSAEAGSCGGISLNRILVPVDFSDCSLDAVEYAALMAQRHRASVTLLHVLEPVSYGLDFTLLHSAKREEMRERLTARLDDMTRALVEAKIQAVSQVRGGTPFESILDSARTIQADLIVMGTHGRRGLSHALSGSVAEAVLRQSRCPVLTVRSPKFGSGHRRVLPDMSM